MTLHPFMLVLLGLAVIVIFCAIVGIVAYTTVPGAPDSADRAVVQDASQNALRRAALVFFSTLTISITVFLFLVEHLL